MKAVAKITSKGQITIPLEIRRFLGVDAGDSLEFQTNGLTIEIKPQPRDNPFRQFRGLERVGKGKSLKQIKDESAVSRGWSEE
jgi:antitoxin PrlF